MLDLVGDDSDSDLTGEGSSQFSSSMASSLSCLGFSSGLASRQFVQDFREWHLVEHGFPIFTQEHRFPKHPFLQLQDVP
jgi:hypothetical protein